MFLITGSAWQSAARGDRANTQNWTKGAPSGPTARPGPGRPSLTRGIYQDISGCLFWSSGISLKTFVLMQIKCASYAFYLHAKKSLPVGRLAQENFTSGLTRKTPEADTH
jgi:hypothetical protein